jgi:hypothetical protein
MIAPKKLSWTFHAQNKMRQYRLSEQRVKSVLHTPKRLEQGIAPKTGAAMQVVKGPKHSHEIWVMFQDKAGGRTVISAWRYPGRTKEGEPLPEGIVREIDEAPV